MKIFILCLFVALVCAATVAFALPTPNHIMLHDGNRLTFAHDECRKAVKTIIQQQLQDEIKKRQQQQQQDVEANANTTTPTEPTEPTESTSETHHLFDPNGLPLYTFVDALTWINITDIVVKDEDWDVRECTIYRDIHGWRIDANGVDVKATASWSYALEPNAPAITDKGKVDVFIKDANVDAIILAHGDDDDEDSTDDTHNHINNNNNENINTNNNETANHNENEKQTEEDDNVMNNLEEFHAYLEEVDHYTAHVVTFLHNLTLKFKETDYADFYNKMAEEHNEALKWVVSIGANVYLSAALTHYLNPDVLHFQQELNNYVLKNQYVERIRDLSSTDIEPYTPQGEDRLMQLGLILNSLVPSEVETPEEIRKLAHGEHYQEDDDDEEQQQEEPSQNENVVDDKQPHVDAPAAVVTPPVERHETHA